MYLTAVALAAAFCMGVFADQCYFPDGTTSTDVPCNSSATNSACCSSAAYCLSNGACLNSGVVSRGSCTDKSWDADECCPYCQNYNTGGGYAIMACTNTTFTCGFNPDACSVTSSTFTIHNADSIVLKSDQLTSAMEDAGISTGTSSSSDSSSSGTSSSTSVSVVTVTATDSAVPNGDKEYTAGQMAGVGAGVGVPLLLAIGALSWLLLREKRKASANRPDFHPLQSPKATDDANSWTAWNQPVYAQQQGMPTELSNEHGQVVEIDTPHRIAELEPKYRS